MSKRCRGGTRGTVQPPGPQAPEAPTLGGEYGEGGGPYTVSVVAAPSLPQDGGTWRLFLNDSLIAVSDIDLSTTLPVPMDTGDGVPGDVWTCVQVGDGINFFGNSPVSAPLVQPDP